MLTPAQVDHFETFGFLVLKQVFSKDEVMTMRREADEIMSEKRNGAPLDPNTRQAVQPFFEYRPFLHSLIADDRIYGIAESILGDFFLIGTEGNLHVGQTCWHGGGDSYELLPSIKIGFYLEPLTRETGALRVIPGTHKGEIGKRLNVLEDLGYQPDKKVWGMNQWDIPSVALESQPGDIVVFTESIYHSAWGGHAGRHQHAINFFKMPETQKQIDYVRGLYEGWTYALHPATNNIDHDNLRLRKLVAPLLKWGFSPYEI